MRIPRLFLLDIIVVSLLFRILLSWLRLAADCKINIYSSIGRLEKFRYELKNYKKKFQ